MEAKLWCLCNVIDAKYLTGIDLKLHLLYFSGAFKTFYVIKNLHLILSFSISRFQKASHSLCIMLLLASCGPIYYFHTQQNIPLLTEKNEVKASGHATFNGLGANLAVSPIKHLSLQLNVDGVKKNES
jgi:hypothetical protein